MSEAPSEKTIGGPTVRPTTGPARGPTTGRGAVDLVLYATARLLLAVVVSGAIYGLARLMGVADFPLVVAALGGLVISMPLGIWAFSPLRRRATAALAVTGERRRRERDQLRARLRGEVASPEEPDRGQDPRPDENRDVD